ncbi:MAG: cytidylate kinase-like family protein [Ruthenibacterium sp.]
MSDNLIICIGRQFGSGGHEIGEGLAKALDIPCYDKEILKHAALESGIVEELFEKADEKPNNSFLYSLSMGSADAIGGSFTNYNDYLTNDKLFLFQSKTIKDFAQKSPCVIIGRCADYILRGEKKMLSVFVHAPLELRIQRISHMRNIDEDAARSLIKKTDKSRANYYAFYADNDWGAAESYDLSLNSGKLNIDKSIQILKNAAQSL